MHNVNYYTAPEFQEFLEVPGIVSFETNMFGVIPVTTKRNVLATAQQYDINN